MSDDAPIERLIDESVLCGCCGERRPECTCAEGVRCGVCGLCALHCADRDRCRWWWKSLETRLRIATKKNGDEENRM